MDILAALHVLEVLADICVVLVLNLLIEVEVALQRFVAAALHSQDNDSLDCQPASSAYCQSASFAQCRSASSVNWQPAYEASAHFLFVHFPKCAFPPQPAARWIHFWISSAEVSPDNFLPH